jgi:subtilase family serine protease
LLHASLRARRRALTALLVTTAIALPAFAAVPASAGPRRVVVHVDRPAVTASALRATALAGDDQVEVEVVLDLEDRAGAEALATAVSTPGSPQYRQYLSPTEWIARFSPAQADVDALVGEAEANHLTVEAVPTSRLFVLLTGSVDDVEQLFATSLRGYDDQGSTRITVSSDVSLPSRAAAAVETVAFDRPTVQSAATPMAAKQKRAACSAYWNQHRAATPKAYGAKSAATALCGYTPTQVRALYGLGATSDGVDGRGQTVAVIDAFGSPTMRADLATYSARNHLPAANYSEVLPARSTWNPSPGCTPADWQGEQALDLEAVHAVAPRASLVYVGASDCAFGFDVAMSTVLDRRLATIVSNSWGSTGLDTFSSDFGADATIVLNTNQHLQAAGEGIGLYFASGDLGDDSPIFGQAATDFPASSPWVTAVGGTSSALDRKNRLVFSTAWGDAATTAKKGARSWRGRLPGTFLGGAGGGTSSLFSAPSYQSAVPTSLSGGMRTSTDVAALASPYTGFAIGFRVKGRYTSYTAGGTSLATPIVAAQVALAQQRSGRQLGFLNPAVYRAAASVRDVVPSSGRRAVVLDRGSSLLLVTLDHDTSLHARRGYDLPTGLGELTLGTLTALGRL